MLYKEDQLVKLKVDQQISSTNVPTSSYLYQNSDPYKNYDWIDTTTNQ